ncbi:DUF6675 family protein [Treponema sp. C6A8]|uniref:DUF6675 family protein n=1 Tax=Treponema sp. C6A8 TaxID=1410609 RepID=UPI00048668F1|nr:DUF6675 family protein [Treponema sp. C6A8]
MKKIKIIISLIITASSLFANPFNDKLTDEEKDSLNKGEIVIKNIDSPKNMCLSGFSKDAQMLIDTTKNVKPKYLAEVIQYKPYKGNENYAQVLEEMLYHVEDFTDIPYVTSSGGQYHLYESAEILEENKSENMTKLKVRIYMDPFANVYQDMDIYKGEEVLLYTAKNTNKLRYRDEFDCLGPGKMLTCIYLFREGENWVFYAVGGVNAPHIPFFTERIRRSFMNRINTFCNYIFKKF